MTRYLVIVARDRPVLFATLAIIFGREGDTELRFDRRRGLPWTGTEVQPDRRTRCPRDRDLQEQGFLVIPRTKSTPRHAVSKVCTTTHWRRPGDPRRGSSGGNAAV